MLSTLHITCLLGYALLISSTTVRRDGAPTVDLGYATYQGSRLSLGVDQYLGMRYAQAPLSDLRFRAPKDPETESSVQDASQFKPICVGTGQAPSSSMAEDCLFVNVFKPSQAEEGASLPVWVYIQGGGYSSNANANYNGTGVVQASGNNIVLVNFNYRVGALGFLASQDVSSDGDLNAGLLDQRQLLHWVQSHISKFGGDRNHVVIHGASAGAGSVAHHLTAYGGSKDNNLFVGAALQSPFWPTQRTVSEMEFQYQRLLQNTNCSSLDCLRSVDLAEFQAASTNAPFSGATAQDVLPLWYWLPVVDGDLVPDRLYNLFEQGAFVHVPLLVGHDANEGSIFAPDASSTAEFSGFIQGNYPNLTSDQLSQIIDAYPLQPALPGHNAWFPSTSAAYGDCTFVCPGNEVASVMARHFDSSKVWNWLYNVQDPGYAERGIGVPHTFETTAIFGVGNADYSVPSYSKTNAEIIPITMHYFISFVYALDPNPYSTPGAPTWQPWGSGTGQRLRLQTNDTEMEPVPQDAQTKCDFWRSLSSNMEV